jgi:hypothetical protein
LINMTDWNQNGTCALTVRLGPDEYEGVMNEHGQIKITTHRVFYPGPVNVEVSLNNYQFTRQRVAHSMDPKSTFWYHV